MAQTTIRIGDYVRIHIYGGLDEDSKFIISGIKGIVVGHKISGDTIVHEILNLEGFKDIVDYVEMPLDEIYVSEIRGLDLRPKEEL